MSAPAVAEKPSLEIANLSAGYQGRRVLQDIQVEIRPGVTGVFGHNGAGKTTLLRSIAGVIKPFSGTVRFRGRDVQELGEAVALVPQDDNVFAGLTVEENLRVAGRNRSQRDFQAIRERVFGFFPDLAVKQAQRAATLSGGQKKMLAFSLALFQRPALLLLDEPSAGLAPLMVEKMMEVVRRVADEDGSTIVLVEQNLAAAAPVVESVIVLGQGAIRHTGPRVDEQSVRELWGLGQ